MTGVAVADAVAAMTGAVVAATGAAAAGLAATGAVSTGFGTAGGCDGPTMIGAMPSSVCLCRFTTGAGRTAGAGAATAAASGAATAAGTGAATTGEAAAAAVAAGAGIGLVAGSRVGGSGSSHDAVKRSERRSASLSLSGASEGRSGSGIKRSGSSQASIGPRASATQPAEKIHGLGRAPSRDAVSFPRRWLGGGQLRSRLAAWPSRARHGLGADRGPGAGAARGARAGRCQRGRVGGSRQRREGLGWGARAFSRGHAADATFSA